MAQPARAPQAPQRGGARWQFMVHAMPRVKRFAKALVLPLGWMGIACAAYAAGGAAGGGNVSLPAGGAGGGTYVALPAGSFTSVLRTEDNAGRIALARFQLMARPVSNADYLAFVRAHPRWRRDAVASVFAEPRYLSHWAGPLELGAKARPQQPVVWVSWFAANAYCQAQGARLPSWLQWEYAAAADERRTDARADPAWRERILAWYARPSNRALPGVGQRRPNAYGLYDLHGLVWEWTEDFSALLVSADNRNQGDPDRLKFCGAGAISINDRDNYAVLMRVAMLSSLEGADATANLGFRCAR